jgi:hypothetical protein
MEVSNSPQVLVLACTLIIMEGDDVDATLAQFGS